MPTRLLLLILVFSLSTLAASGQVILSYDFTSPNDGTPEIAGGANLDADDFTITTGIDSPSAGNPYSTNGGSGFTTTDGGQVFVRVASAGYDSFANASTNDDYFSFVVTPDSGYQLNLTGVELDARITSENNFVDGNAAYFSLRSEVDNFSTELLGGTITSDSFQNYSADPVQVATGETEFRLYVWADDISAQHSSGAEPIRFDNVKLEGTTTVVPEPGATALILGALGMATLLRRRR